MGSEAVNDFHKYCFYHELMEKNINPVIIDNLVSGNEQAPEVVQRQPGRPATKRLRLGRSRFSKPEDSPIICSVCNKRGHNKRSCNARQNAITTTSISDQFQEAFENITLPPSDVM
jgi:hypothetical protein